LFKRQRETVDCTINILAFATALVIYLLRQDLVVTVTILGGKLFIYTLGEKLVWQ
jgi:hypothetical protein